MNQCTFLGRLTRDPEIRYAKDSQMPIARFTLAVDRRGGESEEADFFNCVAFDRRAEFAEKYLYRGIRVVVSGNMKNNNYTNREGEKVYGMELNANLIEFADGKREQGEDELPSGTAAGLPVSQAGNTGQNRQSASPVRQAAGRSQTGGARQPSAGNGQRPSQPAGARQAMPQTTSGNRAPQPAASANSSSRPSGSRAPSSRSAAGRAPVQRSAARTAGAARGDGFANVPSGMEDGMLPFN